MHESQRIIHVFSMINSATVNTGKHVSFQTMFFSRYMPGVGLLGHIFSSSRNLHTVLHSDCTNLIPTNSVQGFPSLQVLSNTGFLFLITAILTGVRWQVIVVLICISPKVSDAQHIFIYLLAICMSSSGKCLFRSFARIRLLKRAPQEVPLEKKLATTPVFLPGESHGQKSLVG